MKILLEIPDEKASALMEVLNDISYVKTSIPTTPSKRKTQKTKEPRVLRELRQAIKEVKFIEAGKKKGKSLDTFLNDL